MAGLEFISGTNIQCVLFRQRTPRHRSPHSSLLPPRALTPPSLPVRVVSSSLPSRPERFSSSPRLPYHRYFDLPQKSEIISLKAQCLEKLASFMPKEKVHLHVQLVEQTFHNAVTTW
mgnify:CR=1 FL=1